jgi:hypothetical protein
VLAITPPYSDRAERAGFEAEQAAQVAGMGVMTSDGAVHPGVASWIRLLCRPEQWLELRFVSAASDVLRGVVAHRRGHQPETVVALRNAELVTFTEMCIDHAQALVPALSAGLTARPAARFDAFAMPAAVGARADEQLRDGAELSEVLDFLGVPRSARPVVEAAFGPSRRYVEVVAGEHRDGHRVTTEVGVSIVDTPLGHVLVSPARAFDGEWVSTFAPATSASIAAATERLTATLPSGSWFPGLPRHRDFDEVAARRERTVVR